MSTTSAEDLESLAKRHVGGQGGQGGQGSMLSSPGCVWHLDQSKQSHNSGHPLCSFPFNYLFCWFQNKSATVTGPEVGAARHRST